MFLGLLFDGADCLPTETPINCDKFDEETPINVPSSDCWFHPYDCPDAVNAVRLILEDLLACTKMNVSIDGLYFIEIWNTRKRRGLDLASVYGLNDIVIPLLNLNVDVNKQDQDNITALGIASSSGNTDIVFYRIVKILKVPYF